MEKKKMRIGVTFDEGYGGKEETISTKTSLNAEAPDETTGKSGEYLTNHYAQNVQPLYDIYNAMCYQSVAGTYFYGQAPACYLDSKHYQEYLLTVIKEQVRQYFEDVKREKDLASKKEEAELKEKQEEGKEKLRVVREMSVPSIRLDSEGRFVFRYMVGIRKYEETPPIFSVSNIKLNFLYAYLHEDVIAYVSWEGAKKKIYLMETDLNGKKFLKLLTKAGVEVRINKKNREMISDQVLAYLTKNADLKEIPYCNGWCLMENGWHFNTGEECLKTIKQRGSCVHE